MKPFSQKAVLVLAGLLAVTQHGKAQYLANDLALGFNHVDNGGVGPQPSDYIIDLGSAFSSVGVGGSTVVNLSSYFNLSTFNATYSGGLPSGVSMSVVGGNPASGSSRGLFATVQRLSLGNPPSVPGSSAPDPLTSSAMGSGANDVKSMINGLGLTGGGSTTVLQADPNSFSAWVLSTTPPSYESGTGIDPRGYGSGSTLYEDLYRADSSGAFSYTGYFTLDAGNGNLTFTPSAIPEPSSLAFAGAGLAIFWSLRRFKVKMMPSNQP
jgi:hypothetical protein